MATERARAKEVPMSSEPERITAGDNGNGAPEQANRLAEERDSYVRSWSQISSELPEDFSPHHVDFVRDYFRAQLRIARGKRKKAKRIIDGLIKRTGFLGFEEENQALFAAVDIAVRGSTNRKVLGKLVEPSFTVK